MQQGETEADGLERDDDMGVPVETRRARTDVAGSRILDQPCLPGTVETQTHEGLWKGRKFPQHGG